MAFSVPAWLRPMLDQPPPPLRPHVVQESPLPGPPVVIGDEPGPDIAGASRVAEHFYRQALRRGKKPADAAAIARGQAMNFLHKLGIFKPIPDRHDY